MGFARLRLRQLARPQGSGHDAQMRVRFLGTGASGGTPGPGRSARRESSLLISDGSVVLIDVTRDFSDQARWVEQVDGVLLTHGHRDAIGGLPQLARWWLHRGERNPIDVFMSAATAAVIKARYKRLEHCRLHVVRAGRRLAIGGLTVSALSVPHAREARFETYAWRIEAEDRAVVYASDVARLTPELKRFSAGATMLILDGAMWQRRLFSHLTIDDSLPEVCSWSVGAILLTQIGRTAPPHSRLQRQVAALCSKARPAHDGLVVTV
jgi:phosphoribosyl 1,2-cyclic phosphodiesterase